LDNLVLIRVAAALRASLARSVLRDVKEEGHDRSRLIFEVPEGTRSVVISLRPELPWIGRPAGRPVTGGRHSSPVGTLARKLLRGAVLETVSKPSCDRVVRLEFADGHTLVAELATHGANLILLDGRGRTLATARRPRSSHQRLAQGTDYTPRPLPRRLTVPFGKRADEIDSVLENLAAEGESTFEGLRRHLFGVGTAGANLVVAEARATGRSAGDVLDEHLQRLEQGLDDPVISGPEDLLNAAERGELAPDELTLLPWKPVDAAGGGKSLIERADAAATAGLYHEALERAQIVAARAQGLRDLLRKERERVWGAEQKAARDLESFEDPERYRCWGEALLAGLGQARRVGEAVRVPDPYAVDGGETLVPAAPGISLQEVAAAHFRRHRRAKRGLEHADERRRTLRERGVRLERLAGRFEVARSFVAIEELEAAMRSEGIPVGLQATRRAREKARQDKPRLEGVRIYATNEGLTLLVGRGARENHRLTFKLASPDDFWFHAQGCRGAHVILRNEERLTAPPDASLRQAAAAAAWFSEAKSQDRVDVQWTRRKNVRKPRSAPLGTVVLKRFKTVRVSPTEPINR
jgi:predicted ribosome quality control (RQC) complex YloA/Tae2 family protein